ncbi:hypothetical protein CKAN_00979300 [Cinnamomum micranthum f. kanehirae]|uniref:Uncharacterized protein n=1 Tax=Cinnamomum micranthum f. kanehirae TaxID=337451 RepID=A0A443NRH9_9MAGN|nr:hypothetical protein CKAN_00979300 [Cinnamomum micranthum f. kanehirae]
MASSLKLPLKATLVLLFLLSLVSQQIYLATATKLERAGSITPKVLAAGRPYARGRLMLRNKKMEIEAFRPTSPGHSPGMGHDNPPGRLMLRNKKMETGAFRPTSPGHSPGMGHDTPPQSRK